MNTHIPWIENQKKYGEIALKLEEIELVFNGVLVEEEEESPEKIFQRKDFVNLELDENKRFWGGGQGS